MLMQIDSSWWGNLLKNDHVEDQERDENFMRDLRETGCENVD